jgi:hypothetical protein
MEIVLVTVTWRRDEGVPTFRIAHWPGRPVKLLLLYADTVTLCLVSSRSATHVRVSKWGLLFDEERGQSFCVAAMFVAPLLSSLTAKLLLPLASTVVPSPISLSGGSGSLQPLSNRRGPIYLCRSSVPTFCLILWRARRRQQKRTDLKTPNSSQRRVLNPGIQVHHKVVEIQSQQWQTGEMYSNRMIIFPLDFSVAVCSSMAFV